MRVPLRVFIFAVLTLLTVALFSNAALAEDPTLGKGGVSITPVDGSAVVRKPTLNARTIPNDGLAPCNLSALNVPMWNVWARKLTSNIAQRCAVLLVICQLRRWRRCVAIQMWPTSKPIAWFRSMIRKPMPRGGWTWFG